MMLDPKRTFDELIDRVAPDAARAEEIKANRVYRELSTAVSGSQEFTAVAKLYELDRGHDFDLLVLDTPRLAQRAGVPRRPAAADLVPRGPGAAGARPARPASGCACSAGARHPLLARCAA